jgi:hypothetical protein
MLPDGKKPILPWRLVAGAFLHFIVPAYLLSLLVDGFVAAPHPATADRLLQAVLLFTGRFLGLYALVALVCSIVAAVCDPVLRKMRTRRNSRNPEVAVRLSQQRLVDARAQARRMLGDRAVAPLAVLDGAAWDHGDPRLQALTVDLEDIVHAAQSALAVAETARRAQIIDMAVGSLDGIAAEFDRLDAEARRRTEGDMRTVARYVETRYGSSDFSGERD